MIYTISTFVDGKTIGYEKEIGDPFVRHLVVIGWRDLLRGLFKGELEVKVVVSGDPEAVMHVMSKIK